MASPSGDQSTQDLVVADSNVPSSTSTLSSSTPEDDGAGNIPPGLPPYVASDSADDDNHHEPSNSNPSIHQQDTLPQPAQQPAAPAQTQEGEDVLDTLQGNEEASEQPAVSAPQPPAPENNTNVAFDTIQPSATNEDLSDSSESCDSCFSDVSESDDDEMDSEDSEAEDGGASVEGAELSIEDARAEIEAANLDQGSEDGQPDEGQASNRPSRMPRDHVPFPDSHLSDTTSPPELQSLPRQPAGVIHSIAEMRDPFTGQRGWQVMIRNAPNSGGIDIGSIITTRAGAMMGRVTELMGRTDQPFSVLVHRSQDDFQNAQVGQRVDYVVLHSTIALPKRVRAAEKGKPVDKEEGEAEDFSDDEEEERNTKRGSKRPRHGGPEPSRRSSFGDAKDNRKRARFNPQRQSGRGGYPISRGYRSPNQFPRPSGPPAFGRANSRLGHQNPSRPLDYDGAGRGAPPPYQQHAPSWPASSSAAHHNAWPAYSPPSSSSSHPPAQHYNYQENQPVPTQQGNYSSQYPVSSEYAAAYNHMNNQNAHGYQAQQGYQPWSAGAAAYGSGQSGYEQYAQQYLGYGGHGSYGGSYDASQPGHNAGSWRGAQNYAGPMPAAATTGQSSTGVSQANTYPSGSLSSIPPPPGSNMAPAPLPPPPGLPGQENQAPPPPPASSAPPSQNSRPTNFPNAPWNLPASRGGYRPPSRRGSYNGNDQYRVNKNGGYGRGRGGGIQ